MILSLKVDADHSCADAGASWRGLKRPWHCAPSPAEWHRRVVVIVARHPKKARVLSAEFGERRRAGNGIRDVIVAAVGMRDGVPANRARATLKPDDLALKAIIVRQDDAATVQIAEQFGLGLLGQVIRDAMLAEQLARNSPAYRSPVTRVTR